MKLSLIGFSNFVDQTSVADLAHRLVEISTPKSNLWETVERTGTPTAFVASVTVEPHPNTNHLRLRHRQNRH